MLTANKIVTISQMIAWGIPLDGVPQEDREAFANCVMRTLEIRCELTHPEKLVGILDNELIQMLNVYSPIEAIKLYKARTGAGLKESKQYVDALRERISAKK